MPAHRRRPRRPAAESGLHAGAGRAARGRARPWGRPFRYDKEGLGVGLWSTGPDGADQGGFDGDDVPVRETTLARRIDVAPRWFLGAALVLLWLAGAIRAHRAPRSPRLAVEVARAAVMALGPLVGLVAFAYPLSMVRRPGLDAVGPSTLIVPWPVAFFGTGALLLLLAALWVRTRRPAVDDDRRARPALRAWLPWVVVVVALAGGTTAWRDVRRERWSGSRVLMLAQLGHPDALVDACLDPSLTVRDEILAHPPPCLPALRVGALARIAELGPDALEVMLSALASRPTYGVPSEDAIAFVREHDPTMSRLAARADRDPVRYVQALLLLAPELATSWGARGTVERLVTLQRDLDRSGVIAPAARPRIARRIEQAILGIMGDQRSPRVVGGDEGDEEDPVRRVQRWWTASGASGLAPLRQVIVTIRRLTGSEAAPVPLDIRLEAAGGLRGWRPDAGSGTHRLVERLAREERSIVIRVVSGEVERAAVPLDVPPEGCTVFVEIDWLTLAHEVRVVRHPD